MQAAADHVTHQFPNKHIQVGYLLDAIQCSDAGFQDNMASIKTDQDPNGMKNNLEAVATHLLPCAPFQEKITCFAGTKSRSAEILDATNKEAGIYIFGMKKGIGKTGVHIWYHSPGDYKKLPKERKEKLLECKKTTDTDKGKLKVKDNPRKYNKPAV